MSADSDFDYREIDDVIHGRVRLSVMAFLSGAGAADFNELKARVGGTDGNLSVHLSKLEDAGYIAMKKGLRGKRPQTTVSLSKKGREAWIAYITRMEDLLRPNAAE
ncbi:winged helix-turn-helix domain-containing protein [Hyphococcus sp.]|uniref:winged helix-turn-helix domain-containing protein n=1 Tax=Hyphococcus sp. TaxID=2038636 RepID=UPI00207F0763|nr:MAG: transcriptional regulator [Marinicaulis sp.]